MKKFDYKQVGKEIGWNFSKINPIVEHSSDFDYYKTVIKNINPQTKMLDIGCGSAEKALRFFSLAKKVYETDFEIEMLKKAKQNAEKYYKDVQKIKNKFAFKKMDCYSEFPFKDCYFDVVVSRHCGANMSEVYRVLKKGGVYVSEDYSCDDCQELKTLFGRGQGYEKQPLYKEDMKNILEAGFSEIKLFRFEQIEYYKNQTELKYLLTHTPILGYFDDNTDDEKLQEYIKNNTTKKGIRLNRRLYAFELKK